MRRLLLAWVPLLLATLAVPSSGQACSYDGCGWPQLAPSAGSTVPANLPAFAVDKAFYRSATLSVTRTDGSGSIVVAPDFSLGSNLAVGASYDVKLVLDQGESWCPQRELTTTILAGPEAPIPSSLGAPTVKQQGVGLTEVPYTDAQCSSSLRTAYVDLEPSLDGAAAAFRSTLVDVRAIVDGRLYWLSAEEQPLGLVNVEPVQPLTGGDVRVRVFVACDPIPDGEADSYDPLTEGMHRVKLRGTIPGVGNLETSETEITLICPQENDAGADLGEGGLSDDAGANTQIDGSANTQIDGSTATAVPSEPRASTGSSCAVSRIPGQHWQAYAFLLCAGALAQRRRWHY